MSTNSQPRASRKPARRPRLVTAPVLPMDEQALLTAYRTMDDQARGEILRMAIRRAATWPAPAQRGPRLIAMPAAVMGLLRDFGSMGAEAQHDVCCMVAAIAKDELERAERQPLRLIIGGLQ